MAQRRKRVVEVDQEGAVTPQQRLDAPGVHEHELETKVHVFRSGKHPTLLDDLLRESPDPFEDLYEGAILDPETGKPDPEKLGPFEKAHQIDEWIKSRENQRGLILAKQEEDEGGPVSVEKQEELLISHALEVEDDRAGVVETVSRNLIIEPPFHPAVLEGLTTTNNTLNPLIGAMEVNVAGTGWELLPVDTFEMEEAVEDEIGNLNPQEREAKDAVRLVAETAAEKEFDDELAQQREGLEDFFQEPWPGTSWTTMERKIRRDMEKTGNAYVEVIRNAKGDIALARRIDPKLMRIVRLDNPVIVDKEMKRGGSAVTLRVPLRERRFVEQVGGGAIIPRFRQSPSTAGQDPDATVSDVGPNTAGQAAFFAGQGIRIIYFKEFGASRELDMWTGTWAKEGEVIPFERRATEIIHRTVNESHRTPYGLPRWINEMPAVLGSRKAEEFNLAFFDAGGVPPMLITISGGQMAQKAHDALEQMMNGQNPASKHQAVVLEITGGQMGKANRVQIGVERFGSERTQDSMFQNYDKRSSDLVRMSFRLPPIFMGDAETHNFNTVKSSYLVAEAQVFQPERDESDEIVTMKLLRNMPNGENFRFHSLPLVVDDTSEQIECIKIAAEGGVVPPEQIVQALNKVCGLEFQFDQAQQDKKEAKDAERMDALRGMAQRGGGPPQPGGEEDGDGKPPQKPGAPPGKSEEEEGVAKVALRKIDGYMALAMDLADALGYGVATAKNRADLKKNLALYDDLFQPEKDLVDRMMALRVLGSDEDDVREVFGCTAHLYAEKAREPEPEA